MIKFRSIKVDGYRGRHFELNISKTENHSVFVMDGNTGKTTIVELLRWCFIHKESEAIGKFQHMWYIPAHILDYMITGEQECVFEVQFEDDQGRHYRFERRTVGTHDRTKEAEDSRGDEIKSISDTLEIDRGAEVYLGDDVNEYLDLHFRIAISAPYFCFDGEKARDMIRMATTRVDELVDMIRQRTTHMMLESYIQSLNNVQRKLIVESEAKLSDQAGKKIKKKLDEIDKALRHLKTRIDKHENQIALYSNVIDTTKAEIETIEEEAKAVEEGAIRRKLELEIQRENIKRKISTIRIEIYRRCREWSEFDLYKLVNSTMDLVKERGKLPEPYYEDLISSCLEDPPTCQICGRLLDSEDSLERVKKLGRQIASQRVHSFLTSELTPTEFNYDLKEERKRIRTFARQLYSLDKTEEAISLTDEAKALWKRREALLEVCDRAKEKQAKVQSELNLLIIARNQRKVEQTNILRKSEAYRENKPLLDKVEELQTILEESHEKMRDRTIEVISDVISKATTNILGNNFTARLTQEDGLMLGEDGHFGPEVGGYSGKLILSYLFAESMSQVEPIIIDTPAGNVGSHRKKLARHLISNHAQAILLCLPTELDDFAEHFSSKKMVITNKRK